MSEKENKFCELRALLDAELWDDARDFIEAGADVDSTTERWLTYQDACSISPPLTLLMYYTICVGLSQMRFLLVEGADLSLTCSCGQTALMKAARAGILEPMQLLLDHGAAEGIHHRDDNEGTALLLLANLGTEEMFHLLLEYGAFVDDVDDQGCNILHLAVIFSNEEMLKTCLSAGVDFTQKDRYGETPLQTATIDKLVTMQRLLQVAYRKNPKPD